MFHLSGRSKDPVSGWLAAPLFLLLTISAAPPMAMAQESIAAPIQTQVKTVPVVIDGTILFRLRGASAYPAERRAREIQDRIVDLAKDESFEVDEIKVIEEGEYSAIFAGPLRVMVILEADAEVEGLQRQLLAKIYRDAIVTAVKRYREDRSAPNLLQNFGYALGVTLILILLVWAARRLFHRLDDWTERNVRKGVHVLADKSHQLVRAGAVWSVVAGLLRLLRNVVYLVLAYFYLNTVLGLFPWTRPFAIILFRLVLNPLASLWQGFVASLPDLAFLVVLWLVFRYVLKVMRAFFEGVGTGRIRLQNFEADWAEPTFKILRFATIAFALVIAYPYIPGSSSDAFKGVSVFVGVLLSLGSSSLIANAIAGLSMTYRGAFKVGEIIRVGQVVGKVEDVKLMVTRVRTPKNEMVVLPNSHILSTEVVNYSQLARGDGVVLHSTVGIGYDTPWRQVEAMLLEAVSRTDGLKSTPPPFVLQTSLGDFAVNYQVNAYCTDASRMPALYSALHANIQDVFNEHGVQIMSPAYEADPESPKIVPPERWYEAPARKPE